MPRNAASGGRRGPVVLDEQQPQEHRQEGQPDEGDDVGDRPDPVERLPSRHGRLARAAARKDCDWLNDASQLGPQLRRLVPRWLARAASAEPGSRRARPRRRPAPFGAARRMRAARFRVSYTSSRRSTAAPRRRRPGRSRRSRARPRAPGWRRRGSRRRALRLAVPVRALLLGVAPRRPVVDHRDGERPRAPRQHQPTSLHAVMPRKLLPSSAMPSIFTRIIDGELPGRVWRDDRCVAFLSIARSDRPHARGADRRGRPLARPRARPGRHLMVVAQRSASQMAAFSPRRIGHDHRRARGAPHPPPRHPDRQRERPLLRQRPLGARRGPRRRRRRPPRRAAATPESAPHEHVEVAGALDQGEALVLDPAPQQEPLPRVRGPASDSSSTTTSTPSVRRSGVAARPAGPARGCGARPARWRARRAPGPATRGGTAARATRSSASPGWSRRQASAAGASAEVVRRAAIDDTARRASSRRSTRTRSMLLPAEPGEGERRGHEREGDERQGAGAAVGADHRHVGDEVEDLERQAPGPASGTPGRAGTAAAPAPTPRPGCSPRSSSSPSGRNGLRSISMSTSRPLSP